MKCAKLVLPFFFLLTLAMGYAVGQLSFTKARAEAVVCCTTSSDCADSKICHLPGTHAACCVANTQNCVGPNYCRDGWLND